MHGDYSRGHEPDRKRGRDYRRVLLQMGRPVLDADVAASVDALLGEVRSATRGLGCAAGSPDLGFLVTPGRLLGVFAEAADAVTVTSGTPNAWLDYRHRYAGRYPALYLEAAGGAAAAVTLQLPAAADPAVSSRAALWARVEAATTLGVGGIGVPLTPDSPDAPRRVEFALGGATLAPLALTLPAGAAVWLFALEQDEAAGEEPTFWVAPGSYHLDGLVVDARGGGAFPEATFPDAAGFAWGASPAPGPPLPGLVAPGPPAVGTRFVAYLEAWERHITHVEDPGIREEALGTGDTCTRTQLLGQVKLAAVTGGGPSAEALRAAFERVEVSGGELTLEVPASTPTTDPCALPDPAGYRGADNRLYRVEVHDGGGRGQARLKWSRDNGAELFAARTDESGGLVFAAGTPLAAGDIVELLSSVIDLGDDVLAQAGAGGFVPPWRATGQLAQLVAVEVSGLDDDVVFRPVDLNDGITPVPLSARQGRLPEAGLKVRRWHGVLDPQGQVGPHVLEDGITVTLSATGTYRPGQYWQYEARVRGENANGPWRAAPHGPERRFAPLALLEYRGAAEPLTLVAWLDQRFSHLCDLDADDVDFAGGRVGTASDTVQEALEELYERPPVIVDASCGELIVRPENDLQTVFDTIGEGEDRRICIHPGTWTVRTTVEVGNKGSLVITGAGDATRLVADGVDTVLRFTGCAAVRLQDVTVVGGLAAAVGDGLAGSLALVNCREVGLARVSASCGDANSCCMSAVEVRADHPEDGMLSRVQVRDCRLQAGNAQVGLLVVDPLTAVIEGNVVTAPARPWPLEAAIADPAVAGTIGKLVVSDLAFGETDEFPNDFLLAGDNVWEQEPIADSSRVLMFLEHWGNQFVAFTTRTPLGSDAWRALLEGNPLPGSWSGRRAPDDWIRAGVRRLRAQLVAAMFGRDGLQISDSVRADLEGHASTLRTAGNAIATGAQGIVVAGDGTPLDLAFPEQAVLTDPNPRSDIRVSGNRVVGFAQGIHVGTSRGIASDLVTYRATVVDNLIHLRVPGLARGRHGIFVGNAFQLRIAGNTVERREPGPAGWPEAPPIDAIRVYGRFGPFLQIRENLSVGTTNGVVARALNPGSATAPGWVWRVVDNAHSNAGGGVAEQVNW